MVNINFLIFIFFFAAPSKIIVQTMLKFSHNTEINLMVNTK